MQAAPQPSMPSFRQRGDDDTGVFHTKHFRDLKSFYLGYVCQHMKNEFPHTVSYNRFVERQAQQVGLYDEKRGCVDVDIPSLVFR